MIGKNNKVKFYLVIFTIIIVLIIFMYKMSQLSTDTLYVYRRGEYIHSTHEGKGIVPKKIFISNNELPKEWTWCHITPKDSLLWSKYNNQLSLPIGNYCGIIKNQHMPKYCGACYIFASISCLEERYNIMNSIKTQKYNNKLQLSTQHVVNGLSVYQNRDTCKGGHVNNVMFFLMRYGVPDVTCNPYIGEANRNLFTEPYCWTSAPYNKTCEDIGLKSYCSDSTKACCIVENVKMYHIEGFRNIIHNNETHSEKVKNVKTEIFMNGPITASINSKPIEILPPDNIVPNKNCKKHEIDHIVRIIGWTIKNNEEVWIAANSWGTNWGDNGYFYIPIKGDCLGVLDYGFQAVYPKGWNKLIKSK